MAMVKRFPTHPSQPHRICWGCDLYCPADSMRCGNGSERSPHPAELFGDDWASWAPGPVDPPADPGDPGEVETPDAHD
jgi:hypothetical protein